MEHVPTDRRPAPARRVAMMLRTALIVVLALCAMAAVSAQPVSARPEQPIEPVDPPDPGGGGGGGGGGLNPQWADVVTDPGFQALMATAADAQDMETMDGLRSLFTQEPAGAKADSADGDVSDLYGQVLDTLVMTPDGPGAPPAAPGQSAPDSPSTNAMDPYFCSSSFRGAALIPEYSGPYGLFPPNSLLNFCMPNGPYSNDLCTVVPDRGLGVFDFRRACYMHDMAYFWTPLADRSVIDGQFFNDMIASCRAAHPWYSLRRYACYAVGGAYYLGVRLFGAPAYNNFEDIPGYDKVLPPGQSIAQYPVYDRTGITSCEQESHAWLGFAYGSNLYYGQTVYPTGVVHKYTSITFEFVTPGNGRIVASHTTQPARSNCVVHHEPEAFSVSRLPVGQVDVYARYQRWESDGWVRKLIGSYQVSG